MSPESTTEPEARAGFSCTPAELRELLAEHGWLPTSASAELNASTESWLADAAGWLAPQGTDRESLAQLLSLIFHYDAREALAAQEAHAVLLRKGSREVVRALAHEILAGGDFDSEQYKAIVERLNVTIGHRGRGLFHPIRLALAGRVGDGELDRVIILIDRAASAPGLAPVKTIRARILEFCAALD